MLSQEEKKKRFSAVLAQLSIVLRTAGSRDSALLGVCQLLRDHIPYYDWVGFYLVDPDSPRELVLGPYLGEATDHSRIPFGKGICGQAAEREETFIIQDVSKESNYLSCSIAVKSEIVVPLFKGGRVVGELDIDSHELSPFSDDDRIYLEEICKALAGLF